MPKKNEIKNNINENVNENIVVKNNPELELQLQQERQKNSELENKLNSLMAMVDKLVQDKKPEDKPKKTKTASEAYKHIDPFQRVLLINMINAGGTYITHSGKSIRFDYPGQIQPAKFEDVESLRNKYKNSFENLEIRILDDEEDILNALYLKSFYDKNKITFEELEDLINLDAQSMIIKIKSLSKPLQESALSLIIDGVAKKEPKFLDKNKWAVINNEFNINIEELSQTYFVDR
jgi:hypothetical protein